MTIADLFVNLGVKGDGQAQKALGGVKTGLGEVKSMSLEAKAAILGAIYALESYMSDSAKAGTNLLNFTSATGMSAQALQQWQYAARQAGVSGEEMETSFKGVQQSMSNMLLGKGAPEVMAILANKVGFDKNRAQDTQYVMGQLQKLAQEIPPDIGRNLIAPLVGENIFAAMRRNAFRPEVMSHAPTYSDREIVQLNKVDVAWSNLGNKIKMAIGHMTSSHGLSIVKDISMLTDQILKMVSAFELLAEKLQLFKVIGKIFEGWGFIFNGVNQGINAITGDKKDSNKKLDKDPVTMISDWIGKAILGEDHITPKVTENQNKNNVVNINQNITHNGDAKDTKAVKDAHKIGINQAARQIPVLAGGH